MHIEVLAHIRASSQLADDRRYVAIAQNVVNFRSIKRTKATDKIDVQSVFPDTQLNAGDIQKASTHGTNTVRHDSGLKRKRSFDDQQICFTDTALSPNRKSHSSRYHGSTSRNSKDSPYHSPLRNLNIKTTRLESQSTEEDRDSGHAQPMRASVYVSANEAEKLTTESTGVKYIARDREGATKAQEAVEARCFSGNAVQLELRAAARPSFSKTKSLPLVIDAPSPTRSQLSAPSYDIPALKATASTFHMPGQFQPTVVTRGIQDKERGYWKVPLTIVASANAQAVTSLAARPEIHSDNRAYCSSFRCPSLTEAEFEETWDAISEYIKAGNAGHCVRAVRRQLVVVDGQGFGNDSIDLYLQIYCHGEAIPYIYAMLLACTKKHVSQCPLQWISALDEKPVITMAEDQVRRGRPGGWKRRRDEQGRSIWFCG